MKKTLALSLAMVMVFILVGCGSADKKPSDTGESSEASTIDDTSSAKITAENYISVFDPYFEEDNYTTIGSIDPTVKSEDGITSYSYKMYDKVTLVLYESEDTGELTQIFYMADTKDISEEALYFFGSATALTINGCEPDLAVDVDEELQMNNFTDNNVTVATGDNCSYTYIVDHGLLMFTAILN